MDQSGKYAETLHYILSFLHTEGLYAAEEALLREIDNRYGESSEAVDNLGETSVLPAPTTSVIESGIRDDTAQRRSGSASTAGRPASNTSENVEIGNDTSSATVRLAQPVLSEFHVRRASSLVDYDSDYDEYENEADPGYIREEVRNQDNFVATELYYHSEERSNYFQYYVSESAHADPDFPRENIDLGEPQEVDLAVVGSLNHQVGFQQVLEDNEALDLLPASVGLACHPPIESESQSSEVSVSDEPGVLDTATFPFGDDVDLAKDLDKGKAVDSMSQRSVVDKHDEEVEKDSGSFLYTLSMFGKLFGGRQDAVASKREQTGRESISGEAPVDTNGDADVEASFSFPVTPSSKDEPVEPVFPSWPSFKTYSADNQEDVSASHSQRSSVAPSTSYTGSPESQRKPSGLQDRIVLDWYADAHAAKKASQSNRMKHMKVARSQQPSETLWHNGSDAEGRLPDDAYDLTRRIDSAARWQPALLAANGHASSSSHQYATYEYSEDQIERDFEILDLKVFHRKGATGFEDTKELTLHVGDRVAGRYQVVDFLGSAAFSKAVQALDLKTGGLVCLKIVKNNKDYFDQSLDEIKLLRYVNAMDPHDSHGMLRLYDFFYYKEHLILVCELLRANLYEFQKYNRECGDEPYFTLARIQKIARQVLRSVSFLHSLHLMHCDLKPENILIRSYSRCEVKVIDLGSSCFVSDHLSSYVQSRSYRAPEVVLGLPYNNKIDIWSLGCIFAELSSGYVLFQNESVATMVARLEGILGPLPHHMLHRGRYAHRLYTRNGIIYQRSQATGLYEVLRPKRSSLKHRVPQADAPFLEFLKFLLQVDPAKRPTAEEALDHPWLHMVYPDADETFPKSL